VRKDDQVKDLKENYNAKIVLNSETPEFWNDLQALVAELKPKVMYEYIGGEFPGKVFATLPEESQLVVVGNLTGGNVVINQRDLLFKDLSVTAFYLTRWLKRVSREVRDSSFKQIADDLQ